LDLAVNVNPSTAGPQVSNVASTAWRAAPLAAPTGSAADARVRYVGRVGQPRASGSLGRCADLRDAQPHDDGVGAAARGRHLLAHGRQLQPALARDAVQRPGRRDAEALRHGRRRLLAVGDAGGAGHLRHRIRTASATAPSDLYATADNQVALTIKTASGATVALSLGSQSDGLAVQVTVSGGELDDAERKALVQLSDAFQDAIDGLGAVPPKLAFGGFTDVDPSVLTSIDFKASTKADGKGAIQAVAFHADAKSRSLSASGPSGTVKVDVDLSQPAILGNAAQQAQAMARYLRQIDTAGSRGQGDAALVGMFKDAFSQLNSNYGVTAPLAGRAAPGVIALNAGDHSLLSGLADFSASMVQAPNASNPMRPDEVDSFSYKVSQNTSVTGKDPRNRTIHQDQQAQLAASFHRALSPGASLSLTAAKESQFYEFVKVDDQAKASTDIAYEDGKRTQATVAQSARQSTQVQRYLMGQLASDTTVPLEGQRVSDVRQLLSSVERADMSHDPEDARSRDQALATAASLAVLPDEPTALRHGGGSAVVAMA
jgi:hypothetical protein